LVVTWANVTRGFYYLEEIPAEDMKGFKDQIAEGHDGGIHSSLRSPSILSHLLRNPGSGRNITE